MRGKGGRGEESQTGAIPLYFMGGLHERNFILTLQKKRVKLTRGGGKRAGKGGSMTCPLKVKTQGGTVA